MANALKCDRCKIFYDSYCGLKLTKNGQSYNSIRLEKRDCYAIKGFDLCPKCMEQLIDFLKDDGEA